MYFIDLIGDKQGPIEPHLLSPLVLKLYPSCISKSSVKKDNQKCDKISLPENFAFNTKVPQTNVNVSWWFYLFDWFIKCNSTLNSTN